MGEGVTNPVGGAASSSAHSTTVDPAGSSLLLHVAGFSTSSIELILLLTVLTAIALHWIFRRRERKDFIEIRSNGQHLKRNNIDCCDRTILTRGFTGEKILTCEITDQTILTREITGRTYEITDQTVSTCALTDQTILINGIIDQTILTCEISGQTILNRVNNDQTILNIGITDNFEAEITNHCSDLGDGVPNTGVRDCTLPTSLTSKSEPRLRSACKTGPVASSLDNLLPCDSATPINSVARCTINQIGMDSSEDIPSVPDPQPDSFFTWDSGGSSGEYSFVHTAVELPKYPDGAITEEERQMLLLYMQTGHPELLLTSPSGNGHQNGAAQMSENVLCDPAAVRGFLETIVEENSDDLRSPSECDETSLGWGSWDESDEDRLTVVEMVTSTNSDLDSGDYVSDGVLTNGILSEQKQRNSSLSTTGECDFPEKKQSVNGTNEHQLCERRAKEIPSLLLSGVTSGDNSPRYVPALQNGKKNDICMDSGIPSLQNSAVFIQTNEEGNTCENKPLKMDAMLQTGVSPILNSLDNNNCFDTLWITADKVDSPSEALNPWTIINFNNPDGESSNDLSSVDFLNPDQIIEGHNPLLVFGSDDICLVPSHCTPNIENANGENLMFSDNFKDYFLPAENCTLGFNKVDISDPDAFVTERILTDPADCSKQNTLRCFRIGFDPTPSEECSVPYLDKSMIDHDSGDPNPFINEFQPVDGSDVEGKYAHSEIQNSNLQETMFSPLDGDIVYGSSWVGSRAQKEPEKTSSEAEVHCSTMQADVRCELTMLSESPPPDNNRRPIPHFDQSASDDEILDVPNSLSRWRHHTDLQHLQEATSPITRWQHHNNLQFSPEEERKQTESEESDDGLPPQLKEIYSSFKMRDNKMGRIRIKEDKNNNFKRLGLWDNETKVTLPPFNSPNSETGNTSPKQKESSSVIREELDDLEFDMFAVAKCSNSEFNLKTVASGDSDIDDALQSFNHLDDYSSHSDESSENENSYIVNVREKGGNSETETTSITGDTEFLKDISEEENLSIPSKDETPSPDNPCSDNSDNCPLCTDPSFKNSRINDLFSLKSIDMVEQDVQSLLQKTYPKMVGLSHSNSSDGEIHEANTDVDKTVNSMSPLTSSDSDEGMRTVKEVKKRVKKRTKENSSTELKHDDSGYVEDDDDDEDDSLGENKEKNPSPSQLSDSDGTTQARKSLSAAFYESKTESAKESAYAIPETFQEFSKQLELSLSSEELKAGFLDTEKWNIPENLSQFSAWLLDKELKKISSRDEMEKLLVDDIMGLREQTIAKFLKNSYSADEKLIFKTQDSPSKRDNSDPIDNLDIKSANPNEQLIFENSNSAQGSLEAKASDDDFKLNSKSDSTENSGDETENKTENPAKNDNSPRNMSESDGELPEEYYAYNFNTKVSKIFKDDGSERNKTAETERSLYSDENKLKSEAATTTNIAIEEIPETAEELEYQINNIEPEITHQREPTAPCYDNYNPDNGDLKYNSPADLDPDGREVKSLTDDAKLFISLEPSIICLQPSGPENTGEIQPKVNDTTIQKELTEKALPEVTFTQVAPSSESIVSRNADNDLGIGQDVATSTEERSVCFDVGSGLAGADRDLMTQGGPDRKGAHGDSVRQEADAISSLEAVVVSSELEGTTHVHLNSRHAHCQHETELVVSLPGEKLDSVNSQILELPDITPTSSDIAFEEGLSHSVVLVSSCDVISGDKVNIGSEEVDCLSATSASQPIHEESVSKECEEFTTEDCTVKPRDSVILKEIASGDVKELLVPSDSLKSEARGLCLSTDSELIPRDNSAGIFDKSENQEPVEEFEIQEKNSDSAEITCLTESDSFAIKPGIITCSEKINPESRETSVFRAEYKRSNSLGRESGESDETFELWSGQSKSTPDLRRCHEQQKSSAPLSALLSKSVSQRIEDYLGRNSRESRLIKSLPPNERSRHYRRICVSTETVVERAARFEARSKSNSGAREVSDDKIPFSKRSGSCPPSSMRSNTSWISDRAYRNYNKPTATVRPTIDTHRNGILSRTECNGETRNEKENLYELITGYSKATKVTHKPPVPPATVHLQQTLKSTRLKGRIATARKGFFERLSQHDLSGNHDSPKPEDHLDDEEPSDGLRRFDEFRRSAREERARLAASHPDLGALEAAVRSSKRKIDQLKKKKRKSVSQTPLDAGSGHHSGHGMPSTSSTKDLCLPYRRATGEIAWASCAKRVQEAKARSKSNLAHEQLEIVDVVREQRAFWFKRPAETGEVRAHRTVSTGEEDEDDPASSGGDSAIAGGAVVENSDFLGTRARSMDFLLDADNRERVQPPENRLASGQARVKSEHELRIERSLQNLTVPDWYKQSAWSKKPTEGFILRRGSEGSAGESRKRWQGFSSSRTPSATSLTTPPTSYSHRNIVVPKRATPTSNDWRYVGSLVSSRESLTPASPASLSPRECASAAFQYGLSSSLSRWSSSRLSTSSAPLTALSVHRSFRQPYLGWRAAAASSGYTPSSGGGSRSSPGVSPVNATTPLQGSRPESPRRGSQEHHFVYGLQQNQITSAATLRPDGGETADSNRISPLALNTTNVFFHSNAEVPNPDQQRFGSAEMRRDRYSYTQSLYSGTVIVSPGMMEDDRRNFNLDQMPRIISSLEEDTGSEERFRFVKSPQPPPRIWMESSFVGTKKDGSDPSQHATAGRSIRIVPSDSARPGTDRFGSSATGSSTSSLRGTCATQTTMDTRELIDHLHNFLRGLQNRNQVLLQPSSTSAFTPVPSSSNSGFQQTQHDDQDDDDGSNTASLNLNRDQRTSLIDYDSEPKAYPRGSWRHSSSSSKDLSPDNSSTDNELWLSVGEDMGPHKVFRTTPEHLDGRSSSRSSISPPSPPMRYPQPQKRVSEDSTGSSPRPIFFASSRRGSNLDTKNESYFLQQQNPSPTIVDARPVSRDEVSRKSSSVHSEESGFIRRDSRSGGSNSWRDSKTDQESSSATPSRGEKDSKSSASMEEVLESLLAIPPTSSRSSSPTSPRRSKGPSFYQSHRHQAPRMQQERHSTQEVVLRQKSDQHSVELASRTAAMSSRASFPQTTADCQQRIEDDRTGGVDNDQGKMFDDSFSFPQTYPSSNTSSIAKQLPISSPLDEVNHGSFCRSSSTSPLEDDIQSPTSMEVLVPEGEEQELSSIIEDEAKFIEEYEHQDDHVHYHHHDQLRQPLHECQQHEQPRRPPLQRQSTLPSCGSADLLPQQPQEDVCANLFAGLQTGSYSRGVAEGSLRRPQSLCLVLLHLPCMFCARALAPPPTINSFSNGPTRMTCLSEPSTPVRELACSSSYEPGPCCGQPVNRVVLETSPDDFLSNLGSNPGRGPSTTDERGDTQEASGSTPTRKKKAPRGMPSNLIATTEGHLKCHRPKCTKSLPVEEARAKFRTCPNCYTYYCSRQCRKLHLARHKDHCPQTRISNLCKQVLMKARDDPVSRRHLSLCAKRGLLSRGRGAVKLLFLNPEDALEYLVHGWESAKGQTLYVSRSDLLPQEMGSDVFSQVRNFCDKYNPERKFILLAAITVTNEIAAALEREVVVRGAKMHLSPSLPEDDVQTLILTITKTDPETGDPAQTTEEDRRSGLKVVEEQLSARGVDLEKLYPHTYRKLLKFVAVNEPFSPISIFPTDQRNGRVFMCIILPFADPDIIVNISSKSGAATGKSSKKKWIS